MILYMYQKLFFLLKNSFFLKEPARVLQQKENLMEIHTIVLASHLPGNNDPRATVKTNQPK